MHKPDSAEPNFNIDPCDTKGSDMINAIQLLKMEAAGRRSMTTPNAHTITEYTARHNAELADEYELAAEALKQLHNRMFEEGILAGMKRLADSCEARQEKK